MATAIKKSVTIQRGGVVEIRSPRLKAGALAEVIVLLQPAKPRGKYKKTRKTFSIFEWLDRNAIDVPTLPRDMAHQHDHYLYGLPKKAD